MVSVTFSARLGGSIPSFMTGVTALDIAWSGGEAHLYTANRAGLGAGYAMFDISNPVAAATLVDVQGYAAPVHAGSTPAIVIAETGSGSALIAAGLSPSGWASYQLDAQGRFSTALNTALDINPVAVTSATLAGTPYVFLAPDTASSPVTFRLGTGGTLAALSPPAVADGGPRVDSLGLVQTANGAFLLAASASGDSITSYAVDDRGGLTAAGHIDASAGTGFSAPTSLGTLTLGGITYVVAAASQSSSLSVFRLLPDGSFYATDHVVDNLGTRFSGATAMTTLQVGDRGFVLAGGSDDGISVMAMLPDGRLVHLLTIADTGALSLADVTAIAAATIGGKTTVFAASATEPGVTQLALDLGLMGKTIDRAEGVQLGTACNDLLVAGAGTTALQAGAGDDILVAGGAGGGASLSGGAGADIFVLQPSQSTIHITDYQPGLDRLDLTGFPMLRNLGQLSLSQTATGARIIVSGTTILIDSLDGNPLPLTAFAQSQMLPLDRFPPHAPSLATLGTLTGDILTAAAEGAGLVGLAGDDSLQGAAGNDFLEGDSGNDLLSGGAGQDVLTGDAGNDSLDGGTGNDSLDGGTGNDTLDGGAGNDTLLGGAGDDHLAAAEGANILDGGTGQDWLQGGSGQDSLFGGDGNDRLADLSGQNLLQGDLGNDTILAGGGHDTIYGGAGDDSLTAGGGQNLLDGGDGNDTIAAGALADLAHGGNGDDSIIGGTGADSLFGDAGQDTLTGQSGNDLLYGGSGDDLILGGDGNNSLAGGTGNDILSGGSGNDTLTGDAGNDRIWTGDGNNRATGGDGHDQILGGTGSDTLDGRAGNDTLGGFYGDDSLDGGTGNDLLAGDAGNDVVAGGDGNDSLTGSTGDDTLIGGTGLDTLRGGPGLGYLDGGADSDYLVGDLDHDVLIGGDGSDVLLGYGGPDLIYGGYGNDTICGGAGQDTIVAGPGADLLIYHSAAEAGLWSPSSDRIYGFTHGQDKLGLRGLGLHFAGSGTEIQPHEIRYFTQGGNTTIIADTNGDHIADFTLFLDHVTWISASDLLL